jgi:hypothetical protein
MAVRVRFGPVEGASRITQRVNAALIKEIANAGIRRTQGRRSHPATAALTAQNRGSRRADIVGPRGGPGIIRPVRKQALYWPGAAHPYARVNGVGFEPLIEAETGRVGTGDINMGAISAAI